ncbi:MAG: hypothetical protein II305_04535, partial [Clostridia bacterium]|nr:hypothetical protein [Clostridia bacterium]
MKMTKKVLALALSLMMIVSMFSIVSMSASAAATRADNWTGFITTTLNISGSNPIDEGNYFTLSETDLYVGDSIKTNGNWLNYALNYTNADGEAVSSKVAGMAAWYCDDTKMFTSQLQYAKINGASNNNPVEFTKAGTWRLYANLEDGKQLTLATFEVKELPRVIYSNGTMVFTGSKSIKFYPQDGVPFSEDEIYVGDTIQNSTGGDWWNNKDKYPIHFTKDDGTEITGVITHLHLYGPSSDLYFSLWQGNSNVRTFANAGTYTVTATFEKVTDAEGNSLGNFNADIRTFEVKALPRGYANLDGTVNFDGGKDVNVYADTGIPLSTDDLYVGDVLQNGSGWWKNNSNVKITHDGVEYTCRITYLEIKAPTAGTSRFTVWNGGGIGYTLSEAGTYKMYGQAEGVVNVETGESVGNLYGVYLRSFDVKAAPRQYVDGDGNAVYSGTKALKFYPQTGIPFSEKEVFVGDTIQNSTGGDWWNNKDKYPITFTKNDGTVVTGVITHLHLYGPSADLYFSLWQGNSNVRTFKNAGTYTVNATFEKVTDADGNSLGNFTADIRTFEVKACPHNYELTESVEAGCMVDGYDLYTCSYCAATEKRNEVAASGEHKYTAETTEATCTEAGKTVYTCDCGDTYEEEIEALGHTEETTTVDATCTADGKITVACEVCGTVISETVIEATGHTYVDGVCKCGEIDAECTIQVGDKYYKTFAEAYAAAGENGTITLLDTAVIDEDMTIANVKIVAGSKADPAIRIVNGATVTFENVTI